MLNDEILQLKSYDEQTGREISNVFPITNLEAVKVDNDTNLKDKLVEMNTKIEQTNSSLDTIDKKVDSYIENNSGVADNDKVDYMGTQHDSIKETNDSNVEYLLRKTNIQKYEGSNIIATNTHAKQVNNVILKGVTKYKDINNGEFVENFEEGRNLELVGGKCRIKSFNTNPVPSNIDIELGHYYSPNMTSNKTNGFRTGLIYFPHQYENEGITHKLYMGCSYNDTIIRNLECYRVFTFDKNKKHIETGGFGGNTTSVKKSFEYIQLAFVDYNLASSYDKEKISKIWISDNNIGYTVPKSQNVYLPDNLQLHGIGDVHDTVDLTIGNFIQRIELRPYQVGDENNDQVITDKKNTIYKLQEPVVSKIDLQGTKVYSYDGTTYYNCQSEVGYPAPMLSIEVPTDLTSLVNDQKAEIKLLNDENKVQDQLLSTIMLATDDMYMMIEPLLAETLNETSIGKMVSMYVVMVQRGIKNADEVPVRYREQVKALLDK